MKLATQQTVYSHTCHKDPVIDFDLDALLFCFKQTLVKDYQSKYIDSQSPHGMTVKGTQNFCLRQFCSLPYHTCFPYSVNSTVRCATTNHTIFCKALFYRIRRLRLLRTEREACKVPNRRNENDNKSVYKDNSTDGYTKASILCL